MQQPLFSLRHLVIALTFVSLTAGAEPMSLQELASKLIALKSDVLGGDDAKAARTALLATAMEQTRTANERQNAEYAAIASVADWERYRDSKLDAMRRCLGSSGDPLTPAPLPTGTQGAPGGCEVTGTHAGDGFRVANLVIAARPGLPITANLYQPATPSNDMPAILVVTSHHNSKTQSELQGMGITWARSGCLVIVADNIGYGERRQQPYGGREDYRWRYYLGMQLHTVGESLLGWLVADQRRVLDVLLAQPGVDPKRVIVLGSVAGGGDIAGVLVALDRRPTCSIPYNYGSGGARAPVMPGGPVWTNFIAGGDWDAARIPRCSGRDGFNPWLLVASAAPRCTIFAHEFEWKPAGDEGFARISRIFALYGMQDRLGWTPGHGMPGCNNVSASRRRQFYPMLERWLQMPVPVDAEDGRLAQELSCLSRSVRERWQVRRVHEVLSELGVRQVAAARARLADLPAGQRREQLRQWWAQRLGDVTPPAVPEVAETDRFDGAGFSAERIHLLPQPILPVPVLLLKGKGGTAPQSDRLPVVIACSQEGHDAFLAHRALEVAELLTRGVAVCLVDVRGTGETRPADPDRAWYGTSVDVAARELEFGETRLGGCLRDLRSVVRHLQARPDVDPRRLAVWGDSTAAVNSAQLVDPPVKSENAALPAEPMGAHAALLLALFEDDVCAVLARGGLTGFAALLDGPACHVTLDAIVPQALETGDLASVAASLAPRPVRLEALVDGRNVPATPDRIARDLEPARRAYQANPDRLVATAGASADVAAWLDAGLRAVVAAPAAAATHP